MAEPGSLLHGLASRQQQHASSQTQPRQSTAAGTLDVRQPVPVSRQEPDYSQESTMTSSSSDVFTPTASEVSNGGAPLSANDDSNRDNQLHQLSALAAAQHKLATDAVVGAQKRTADGQVKSRLGSTSPIKAHSRTTSAVSVASTTGSRIGEV
jgi:hypothetical protein